MAMWRRAVCALVAMTFATACYKDVEVRRPAAAVVAPDATAECPRRCAAERFSDENLFARCLSACAGSWRVTGMACGDARIPGSECATEWQTRIEKRARPAGIVGIALGSGFGAVLTLILLFRARDGTPR